MSGVLCVMTPGALMKPLLCVDNWDILLKVRYTLRFNILMYDVALSRVSIAAFGVHNNYVNHVYIPTDAVSFAGAHFGSGTGTIYLDNVGCTGSEANLIDCSRSSTVICTYGHLEDAGVRCQGLENC